MFVLQEQEEEEREEEKEEVKEVFACIICRPSEPKRACLIAEGIALEVAQLIRSNAGMLWR